MDQLVSFEPSILTFEISLHRQSVTELRLRNISPAQISFKVKTTHVSRYSVRPNSGILLPDASTSVQFLQKAYAAPPEDLFDCRDRFQLQVVSIARIPSGPLPHGAYHGYESVSDLWAAAPSDAIFKKKLCVQLSLASHDSVKLPSDLPKFPSYSASAPSFDKQPLKSKLPISPIKPAPDIPVPPVVNVPAPSPPSSLSAPSAIPAPPVVPDNDALSSPLEQRKLPEISPTSEPRNIPDVLAPSASPLLQQEVMDAQVPDAPDPPNLAGASASALPSSPFLATPTFSSASVPVESTPELNPSTSSTTHLQHALPSPSDPNAPPLSSPVDISHATAHVAEALNVSEPAELFHSVTNSDVAAFVTDMAASGHQQESVNLIPASVSKVASEVEIVQRQVERNLADLAESIEPQVEPVQQISLSKSVPEDSPAPWPPSETENGADPPSETENEADTSPTLAQNAQDSSPITSTATEPEITVADTPAVPNVDTSPANMSSSSSANTSTSPKDYTSREYARFCFLNMNTTHATVVPETDRSASQRIAVERAGELIRVINAKIKQIDSVNLELIEARHRLSDARLATRPAYDVRFEVSEGARIPFAQVCIMAIISGALLQLLV